jgi:hypothetical protein
LLVEPGGHSDLATDLGDDAQVIEVLDRIARRHA